jgi:hypothetical protein
MGAKQPLFMARRRVEIENESHSANSGSLSVNEVPQNEAGSSGAWPCRETLDHSVSRSERALSQDGLSYAAELERVHAEQLRYAAQSEARGRAWARLSVLSARLERALREAEDAKQSAERAWSVAAGLRHAFYLRRMSRRRRFIRRLLPKALQSWWDERNLSRLENIIQVSGLFDQAWYRAAYPEAARSGLSPIRDYLQFGAAEGRRPRRDFDPDRYLGERPVLAFLGLNPFVHFVIGHSTAQAVGESHGDDGRKTAGDGIGGSRDFELLFDVSEPEGCFNDGWYGSRRLSDEQRFIRCDVAESRRAASDERLKFATERMIQNYHALQPPHAVDVLRKAAPLAVIRDFFLRAEPDESLRCSDTLPRYAIVTSCASVNDIFKCAASIKALMEADFEAVGFKRITWIVVTSSAGSALEVTLGSMFEGLPTVLLRSDALDTDVIGFRYAASELDAEWVFSIASTDEVELSAISALDYYSANFPRCRCIVASPVDVDEDGIVLRWNRSLVPSTLFEHDMQQGQFIAVRRDLVVQEWKPFDYGALLGLSLREPILAVPEYLHRHRWPARKPVAPLEEASHKTEWALRSFLRLLAERLSGSTGRPSEWVEPPTSGLCIIRTQGTRLDLLAETVGSVLAQTVAIQPCVVVHGAPEIEQKVRDWLVSKRVNATILCASEVHRRRGYPLNVGIEHLKSNSSNYDFVFFLDDDDIIYPFYADRLTALIGNTGCDIGVCLANSRVPLQDPGPGHQLLPVSALVAGNFIPIHCYIVRTDFILKAAPKFDESMDYLEDWDFLVKLLAANPSFALLPEVLCEYRIIGDGNQENKRDPAHFEHCEKAVLEQGRLAAKRLGIGRWINDLADFDFNQRAALSPAEVDRLIQVRTIFEAHMNERDQ